ncbi:MAG: hypothetical protein ACOYKN_04845 [Pirellula sp.]|jgi:hypothetical protein
MTDPFSLMERKFIPWEKYRSLSSDASRGSLINRHIMYADNINERIRHLSELERSYGFTYVGEKKWLTSYLSGIVEQYSEWVLRQFNEFVFVSGFEYNGRCDEQKMWCGYTEDLSTIPLFSELAQESCQVDNVHLFVAGDADLLLPSKLCHAFELLHNLAYYLHVCRPRFRDDVFLDKIVVKQESGHWSMDMINDYGFAGTVEFFGDRML